MEGRFGQRLYTGRFIAVLVCLVALLAGVSWGIGQRSGSAAGPVLSLSAPDQVLVGEPIEVQLIIKNANGISGFDTTIGFDTSVAHLQAIRPQQNDLIKLGRDVQGLGPVEVAGGVAVGAYSCPYNDCTDVAGKQRIHQGGKGTLRLTTFMLVATETGPLTIDLSSARFTDPEGNPIEVDRSAASVTVQVVTAGRGQ